MSSGFIEKLKKRLEADLPGDVSHLTMRPSLVTGQRVNFTNSKNPRDGAVLILFYEREGQLRFPLIQRPNYQGPHGGQISLPGGKRENSDQDLYQTALREAEEEIGIKAAKTEIIGTLSLLNVAASNHLVLPVVGFYPEIPNYIPDETEVDEVVDVGLNDLLNKENLKRTEIVVGGNVRLDSPYFDLGNKVVWGATAGMLAELKDIILEMGL
ncbi:MAG: NUDIX hydrolase [Bacteroidota bacterium]